MFHLLKNVASLGKRNEIFRDDRTFQPFSLFINRYEEYALQQLDIFITEAFHKARAIVVHRRWN